MKRSEINNALRELEAMCEKYHCYLPPFCHFTPAEWEGKGHEYDEVRDCCLGWDITDYGMGDFDKMGFSLITIRNGHQKMTDKYPGLCREAAVPEGRPVFSHPFPLVQDRGHHQPGRRQCADPGLQQPAQRRSGL